MPRWLLIALAFVLYAAIMAGPAFAEAKGKRFLTGNDLHRWCGSNSAAGYVLGVHDGMAISEGEVAEGSTCIPVGVEGGQLTDVACKFVADNAAARHINAAAMVARALRVAYPCAGKP